MSKYKRFSKILENSLLNFCILSLVLLIGVQFFKLDGETVVFSNQEISNQEISKQMVEMYRGENVGHIILKRPGNKYKNIKVIVNNKDKYTFDEKNEAVIQVYENDIIDIDGTMYNEDIDITVVGITKNVVSPSLDSVITTKGSLETLESVELKDIE